MTDDHISIGALMSKGFKFEKFIQKGTLHLSRGNSQLSNSNGKLRNFLNEIVQLAFQGMTNDSQVKDIRRMCGTNQQSSPKSYHK